MAAHGAPTSRRRAAFTLIEMLAVVLILALLATFVGPSFEAVRQRKLRAEAMRLASHLEFARQRAVVTGIPHQILLDLEAGAYRIEWLADDVQPATARAGPIDYDTSGATPLPLAAPGGRALVYTPIPGLFGEFQTLERDLLIAGIETPEGWIERGESFVGFDRDGTATYTEIVLEDDAGQAVGLAVYPLEDSVQILEDEEVGR